MIEISKEIDKMYSKIWAFQYMKYAGIVALRHRTEAAGLKTVFLVNLLKDIE